MVDGSSGDGSHVRQPASGLEEDLQIVIESWACCALGRETFLQDLAHGAGESAHAQLANLDASRGLATQPLWTSTSMAMGLPG